MESRSSQRKVYLDWLRVLGILAVFVYHTSRFFNSGDWHVKNPVTYPWLDLWDGFATTWLMPVMFLISGMSLFYAVRKSGALAFVKDKVLRLVVPLVVGMLTHASIQVYLERITHGDFSGSFLQFLPHYFQGTYEGGNPAAGNFAVTGMHLWYLAWLFFFTLILYPLMRWLVGRGKPVLDWLGGALCRNGAVYLLALPVMLCALDNENDSFLLWWEAGWPLLVYVWLLLSGFILASSEALLERIERLRWVSLVVGVVTVAGSLAVWFGGATPAGDSSRYLVAHGLRGLSSWCWVLAFLGLARRYLTRNTPFLAYSNEAVLPFYVLHQTVILGVGYFVVQWAIPSLLRWIVILVISFGAIMGLYELVRRANVLRVLFGMKWRKRAPSTAGTG